MRAYSKPPSAIKITASPDRRLKSSTKKPRTTNIFISSMCWPADTSIQKTYRKALDHYMALFPGRADTVSADDCRICRYERVWPLCDGHRQAGTVCCPSIPFLNYFRGNIEMKMGDVRKGRDFYQMAFEYDPGIWQEYPKARRLQSGEQRAGGSKCRHQSIQAYTGIPPRTGGCHLC